METWNINITVDFNTTDGDRKLETFIVLENSPSSVVINLDILNVVFKPVIDEILKTGKILDGEVNITSDVGDKLNKKVLTLEMILTYIEKFLYDILKEFNS